MPLIIGTGGNSGSQTVATIIRAITLDEVHMGNLFQALRREVSVGFSWDFVWGLSALEWPCFGPGIGASPRLWRLPCPRRYLVRLCGDDRANCSRPHEHRSHCNQRSDDFHHRRCHRFVDLFSTGDDAARKSRRIGGWIFPDELIALLAGANHVAVLTGQEFRLKAVCPRSAKPRRAVGQV